MIHNSVGLRKQFMEKKASLNVFVNDPFNLWKFKFETSDKTHEQLSRSNFKNRQASISFTYNWGKPPQQQSRRQSQDQGGGAETVQIR